MQTALKYDTAATTARPTLTVVPSPLKKQSNLPLLAAALIGVSLIAGIVVHNLNTVPRSEVERIYSNVGAAVNRTFTEK